MSEIKIKNENWHTQGAKQTLKGLGSTPQGLTYKEVEARLERFGLNKLPRPKRLTRLTILLSQFHSPLIYILVFAGVATAFLKEYLDAAVIWAAVLLNVGIGFVQENKASQALARLKKVIRPKARVMRKGHYKEIKAERVVPGDVILLKPGDKVPADARILKSNNLEINEAPLTGEWAPAKKHAKSLPPDTPLADRDNMVYQGTAVIAGSGQAVVVKTGTKTELGKIALMVRESEREASPLKQKVAHFARILGIIFILISVIVIVIGLLRGLPFVQVLILAAALAVSAVPEGLPVAVTVILALGMRRILDKRGLVRKLIAAETLGSTSVICSDKTGTLTEARMKVKQVFASDSIQALKISMLASEAFVENPEAPLQDWVIRGRATDKALFLGAVEAGLNKEELDQKYPVIRELPFDQTRKYLASLRRFNRHYNTLYVSGAPEVILKNSTKIKSDSRVLRLSDQKRRDLVRKQNDLARQGLRIIGVAYRKIKISVSDQKENKNKEANLEKACSNLIFVGFIGLHDPLRKETKKTIHVCRQAGLRPIIVTGDHKLTARAIAQELGIPNQDENILEGKTLNQMSDRALARRVKKISIYARVSPKHKLRIIDAWQAKGEVVAMTGDGVNDAPALAAADIGVALGSGTDVAHEVSDLVLLDDNFSIIVGAIKEGRGILGNIRRVMVYLLSDAFEEIILVGLSFFLGMPLPLLPIQILWINLVEDGLPDMALAFEPVEKEVMQEKPRPRNTPLLDREMKVLIFIIGLVTDFILLALFFWLFKTSALSIAHIRTVIFVALSLDSLLYVFSCRSLRHPIWQINPFKNKYLVGAVVISLLILVASVYVPWLQTLLKTESLRLNDWLLIIVLAIIDLVAIEVAKSFFIVRKQKKIS